MSFDFKLEVSIWVDSVLPLNISHIVSPNIPHRANMHKMVMTLLSLSNSLNFVTAKTVDTVLSTALNYAPDVLPTFLAEIPEDVKAKSRKPAIRQ